MGGIFGGLHHGFVLFGGWLLSLLVGSKLAWTVSPLARRIRCLLGGTTLGAIIGAAVGLTLVSMNLPPYNPQYPYVLVAQTSGPGAGFGLFAAVVVEGLYTLLGGSDEPPSNRESERR